MSTPVPHRMPPRLAQAHRIVSEAAAVALECFERRDRVAVRTKAPQDFVCAVDERVEGMVRSRLAAAFPADSVVGEEGSRAMSGSAGSCWFIDPIDGTTNFLRGLPWWGVSLGLVLDGRPWIGVVALPALGLIVSAEAGCGLFVNGQPAQRNVFFEDARVVSVGDADSDLEEALALTRQLRRADWMVHSYRCTSLGLAFSALGRLDGHVQCCANAWDIAAGLVLCAEAGLEVRHGLLDARQPTWSIAAVPELASLCHGFERSWAMPARPTPI